MADQQSAHHTLDDIVPGARFYNRAFAWDLEIVEVSAQETVVIRDPLGTGETHISYLLSPNYQLRTTPGSKTKEVVAVSLA